MNAGDVMLPPAGDDDMDLETAYACLCQIKKKIVLTGTTANANGIVEDGVADLFSWVRKAFPGEGSLIVRRRHRGKVRMVCCHEIVETWQRLSILGL